MAGQLFLRIASQILPRLHAFYATSESLTGHYLPIPSTLKSAYPTQTDYGVPGPWEPQIHCRSRETSKMSSAERASPIYSLEAFLGNMESLKVSKFQCIGSMYPPTPGLLCRETPEIAPLVKFCSKLENRSDAIGRLTELK